MSIVLYILFCLISIHNCISLYLTKPQWNNIQNIIRNPNTLKSQRTVVNKILYTKYYQWAYSKAYAFKKIHKYKCRNINMDDLKTFSSLGLIKAIQNYNASFDFHNYAEILIHGELYKGLTDLFPITTVPRTERKKKQTYTRKIANCAEYIGKEEWKLTYNTNVNPLNKLDQIIDENTYKEYWIKIDNLDAFSKKIMRYKFDFYFTKKRSNKEISVLMSCSEETVRKYIKQALTIILL